MAYIKSLKGQSWLLPPAIEKMIPKDHVCFLIESFVESLDFTSFDVKYDGPGHPAYHPQIILKILLMGMLDKVRSSRKLARNARENIVYIYLSEKLSPDFRTISDFRKTNPKLVKDALKHTVTIAKNEGLLDLSHLSTDGTKLKAHASSKRTLTKEELMFLSNFIDSELEEWARQDSLEDDFFGDVRGNDQLPEKNKKKMKKAIEQYIKNARENKDLGTLRKMINSAKEEVENKGLEKVNTTDPQSRFMKSKKGKIEPSYNGQLTTDNQGFILAADICQDANDVKQLQPQVLQTEHNLSELPEKVKWSFDNGYFESDNIDFLHEKKIDGYISSQEKRNISEHDTSRFVYDEERDEYICPEGKRLGFLSERLEKRKNKRFRIYKVLNGEPCKCTKSKKGERFLKRFIVEEQRQKLEEKMKTEEAKEIYKRRKQTVEPTFGDLKENKGMTNLFTVGLVTVTSEWLVACIASNLKRIQNLRQKDRKPPP